jgi:hypothetical protein
MKIDASVAGNSDQSWINSRQLIREVPPDNERSEHLVSQQAQIVSPGAEVMEQANYPSLRNALERLTSSTIFRDASTHIQFASNLNQQKVLAEKVHHLTTT